MINFTKEDKKIGQAIFIKFEYGRLNKFCWPITPFSTIFKILNNKERALIDKILSVNPKNLGKTGKFYGIKPVPKNLFIIIVVLPTMFINYNAEIMFNGIHVLLDKYNNYYTDTSIKILVMGEVPYVLNQKYFEVFYKAFSSDEKNNDLVTKMPHIFIAKNIKKPLM